MAINPVVLSSPRFRYQFPVSGLQVGKDVDLIQSCLGQFFGVIGEKLGRNLIPSGMEIKVEVNKGNNFRLPYQICLDPGGLTDWTVTHELSHALDGSTNWRLSRRMREETGSGFWLKFLHTLRPSWKLFWYRVGSPPPPCGIDKNFNSLEDFAESLTAYIFPEKAAQKAARHGYDYGKWGYAHFHETPRGRFIQHLIDESKYKTPSI
jgi:hypothetical protein